MPSIRNLSGLAVSALGAAQQVLSSVRSPVNRASAFDLSNSATCTDPQLSCHNASAISNLCCFNAPGGALLQTQFWDTHPVTGPSDSWTIHGLWPDNCDGTYDASCDPSRAYTNITRILEAFGANDLLSYMQEYWVSDTGSDESFWEHEWSKHGTCISTLDPDCYTNYRPTEEVPQFFNRTVNLFKTLPSYEWLSDAGIVPSSSATYTTAQIQAALSKNHGGKEVHLGCQRGALNEIWYFFNVRGSVQTGTFVPSDPIGSSSTCPSTGIKYLPKSGASPAPSTTGGSSAPTTTSGGPAPTSSGGIFSGKGFLNVVASGSQNGCIISAGTWYTSGTCATFTASRSEDGFTLSSSKGNCGVVNGAFTCGSSVGSAMTFSADGNSLVYQGSSAWSADGIASGRKQVMVYAGNKYSTDIEIQWENR